MKFRVYNTDYNHDPRGWRDRPSPAGLPRRHRPGCHARPDHASHRNPFPRRTAPARFLPVSTGGATAFRCGFSLQPSAFSLAPTVPDPAELLSTLLTAAQEHFEAASYAAADAFLKLIRLPDPQPDATWQQLGHLHFSLAEYDAAGRAYGYAAAYAPRDAGLQVRLAHTCLHLNDIPSFEGYLRRALALDPESAPALQLLADLNRNEGRYPEAVDYYVRLLQATPGHYENLLSLALCHSNLGDSETALDFLQRAGRIARGNLSPF